MAGMDWFRWHHGSVTDPKFQLVAKKAGVKPADVLAVWACLLEEASQAEDRGNPGQVDFDALDCLLGFEDGTALRIYTRMNERGLFSDDGRVEAWERRQPKREREDDNSTERSKAFRERQRHATPRNATQRQPQPKEAAQRQETPRGEESREEKKNTPPTPQGGLVSRFEDFWAMWPKSERKQDKKKCREKWEKGALDAIAETILADVTAKLASAKWRERKPDGGDYIESPEVYLNNRRWEDGTLDLDAPSEKCPPWCRAAGFLNIHEAGNAGCYSHNAADFRDGKRLEAA